VGEDQRLNKYALDPAQPIHITVVNGDVTTAAVRESPKAGGKIDSMADERKSTAAVANPPGP
jgi:hypothetical protein